MKFNNHTTDSIFDKFEEQYASSIDALWPEITNLEIDVYDDINPDPRFQLKDCIISVNDFTDTPFSGLTGYPLPSDVMNDIFKCEAICKRMNLTNEAKFALIAHEIGHHIVHARTQALRTADLNEEMFCDDCAVKLGLRNGIKTAIQSMIINLPSIEVLLKEWNARLAAL